MEAQNQPKKVAQVWSEIWFALDRAEFCEEVLPLTQLAHSRIDFLEEANVLQRPEIWLEVVVVV